MMWGISAVLHEEYQRPEVLKDCVTHRSDADGCNSQNSVIVMHMWWCQRLDAKNA